jgi:hypothetical protein
MKTALLLSLLGLFTASSMISGCQNTSINEFKIFVMKEGIIHLSFEYNSSYNIAEVQPLKNDGKLSGDIAYVTLVGPLIKETRDHTRVNIIIIIPNELIPDAKSGIERAEKNASSWSDYKLLNKYDLIIDGIPAYRIDYQDRSIVPAIAGVSNEPFIEVIREVDFDANGYVWMIQITSDSSTAEADKLDFEHILQTFKVLN